MAGVGRSSRADELAELTRELQAWLVSHAYPLWWERGADRTHGGFEARLALDGTPLSREPRRARLNPRQVYSYAHAERLGWTGPSQQAVRHGLEFFLGHYRRADGLYRALVAPDGAPLDDTALLYDQAFALLGFSAGFERLGEERLRTAARELHDRLRSLLGGPRRGFDETSTRELPLSSNSHMHLLEASLAWAALDGRDGRWLELAREIVGVALDDCIEPASGALREHFDAAWRPLAGERGRIVEPGHQFEWAWLLLRFHRHDADPRLRMAALRLVEIGEQHGVDTQRRVAINALRDDFTVLDAEARLWPQTERLKAACLAATLTRDMGYLRTALDAGRALQRYFNAPVPGLWRDRLTVGDEFIDEPAPASSMYHIVAAVTQLVATAETFPAT